MPARILAKTVMRRRVYSVCCTGWTAKVRAPDNDTLTKCERLQRKIRELLSSLKKTAKLIVKYAADPAQADSARVTSQSEAIAGLYLAIDKDDVREFDRWDPIVLGY